MTTMEELRPGYAGGEWESLERTQRGRETEGKEKKEGGRGRGTFVLTSFPNSHVSRECTFPLIISHYLFPRTPFRSLAGSMT